MTSGPTCFPILPLPRHVAILDSGAYGYTMSSHYNGRELAAEVFLRHGAVAGVSRRLSNGDWAKGRVAAGGLDCGVGPGAGLGGVL